MSHVSPPTLTRPLRRGRPQGRALRRAPIYIYIYIYNVYIHMYIYIYIHMCIHIICIYTWQTECAKMLLSCVSMLK